MDAVSAAGLCKSYGSVQAVDGLNLCVESGEIFAMLGPAGAGKTTTLEIMLGMRNRDAGDLRVLGMDPATRGSELRCHIGAQLSVQALYPRLTVRETLNLFASFYDRSHDADTVLDWVGLTASARTTVRALSDCQMRRLSVAISLIHDADLVLLDEPTAGLDIDAQQTVWSAMQSLKTLGKTVFVTTSCAHEAQRLCDTVAIIQDGRSVACGTPDSLIAEHAAGQAVEFSPQDADLDIDSLRSLPGVVGASADGRHITLYTVDIGSTIAALMCSASCGGSKLQDVKVRQATLEDVFARITSPKPSD